MRVMCRATLGPLLGVLLAGAAAPAIAQPAAPPPAFPNLRLIAPAAPGGGWDQTARVIQQVLLSTGLARTVSVENIPGAAGTIGLARFVSAERGNGDTLMASGLIMLGAIATYRSALTLGDVTPIARITGEYEILVVPTASPFNTLADFLTAFKANPEQISWGGGSAGGTDQILAGLVAAAVGVDPERVNYIAFSGGGESMSAILGGQVSVGINGLAEFAPQIESGIVRVLAISSAERLPGLDAPTLREQGVDVELENWRSLVAPPGISATDRARLEALVGAMVRSSAWQDVLTRYRWNDRYLDGPALARFVEDEETRVQVILQELGTTRGEAVTLANAGPYPRLVLAGLVLSGLVATISSWRSSRRTAAASGSPGWRAVGLIAAGVVIDILLVERAGFLIASSMLFWLTARAFDAGRPLRDALFAVGVSVGAYVLFARLLELPLPQGVLAGWL
jgi:putative tricarboxylic transport membrane protein